MDREQLALLIEYAEVGLSARSVRGNALGLEYYAGNDAIRAAKEELAKWPSEDEIDETPRIRPEDTERFTKTD